MKRALITGITGQDGYYLTKHLLNEGYQVHGLIRRHSGFETELGNLQEFWATEGGTNIICHYGDVTDVPSIEQAMERCQPHEVYNLAAQSQVRISFDAPQYTVQANAVGTLNMLECTRKVSPYAHFYQASTSEMFGNQVDPDGLQRETTPMIPVSPYGAAKLFGHHMVHQYRNSYGLYAVSGILFNHESPKRGGNFVTQKVVRGAVAIYNGKQDKLQLGNLDAKRDWGHAADYTKMMHLMLQQDKPDDYVIATGEVRTIRDMVGFVFDQLGLNIKKHVEISPTQYRPEDVNYLCGDPSKAERELGWKRVYSFESLMKDMIAAELARVALDDVHRMTNTTK